MPRARLRLEPLDDRLVPSTVSVNAAGTVRTATAQLLGANLTWWDSHLDGSTRQMVTNAGLTLFRQPGGSSADGWHFDAAAYFNGASRTPTFNSFTAGVGGSGMVTLNYGGGSPQEAAAYLAYCNAPLVSSVAIGSGPQWNGSAWVSKDWKTSTYWAGLRASTPLATDDGLNFLRVGRSAPFGWKYWEVGNEIYGSWEEDHHTTAHDPTTYVTFSKQFAALATQIDPAAWVGLNGSGTGGNYGSVGGNWTDEVLKQCVAQGYTPQFFSDHNYMYDPGNESDSKLLQHTATDPAATGYGGPVNWAGRAAAYRTMINQRLGATAGAGVQLLCTEFNSVSYNPGKQTTSLVNGLFLADAVGGLLQTEYNAAVFWDVRNSFETNHNNAASLYGWRQGGDYGLFGDPGGTAPASGTYVPYPTYFAEQLLGKMIHTGDTVVPVTSDDPLVAAYGVKQQNGHLALLVVNKSPTTDPTVQFNLSGFAPSAAATLWRYGTAEDTAQSQTADGHASLTQTAPTLGLTGNNFALTVPHYSMSLLDLAPAPPAVAGLAVNGGAAQRSRLTTLAVTFNGAVTLAAGAFSLTRQSDATTLSDGGASPQVAVATTLVNGQTVATLTFTGTGAVESGSLADGVWVLRVDKTKVTAAGGAMAADYTTPATGAGRLTRLFGDTDGDGDVDNADFGRFRLGLGSNAGGAAYRADLDWDADGDIDNLDFARFRPRLGVTLP